MSFFGKSKKTNEEIERQDQENHQDINDKIIDCTTPIQKQVPNRFTFFVTV